MNINKVLNMRYLLTIFFNKKKFKENPQEVKFKLKRMDRQS